MFSPRGAPGLLVTAHRMWDGRSDALDQPGYVAVAAGRIVDAGEGLPPESYAGWPQLDLGDRTLMPGAIDAHIHLFLGGEADPAPAMNESLALATVRAVQRARATLMAGVTAARDCGGRDFADIALRQGIREGVVPGPRLQVAGKVITMTGGHAHFMGREADGIDDCRRAAREQIKAGVDLVKVMATGGVMTPGVEPGSAQLDLQELAAAVAEARKAGRTAAAHAQGALGVKQAILAGVRSIEHGVYLTEETIELMLERGVYLVPTLSAPHNILAAGRKGGIPEYAVAKTEQVYDVHLESVRRAAKAGVKIAMGTDAGTPFNRHGDNLQEVTLLAGAGLRPAEAWRAATSAAAALMGILDEAGTIESGKRADLIAVVGDPFADTRSLTRRVTWVMQDGTVVRDGEKGAGGQE